MNALFRFTAQLVVAAFLASLPLTITGIHPHDEVMDITAYPDGRTTITKRSKP